MKKLALFFLIATSGLFADSCESYLKDYNKYIDAGNKLGDANKVKMYQYVFAITTQNEYIICKQKEVLENQEKILTKKQECPIIQNNSSVQTDYNVLGGTGY